MSLMDRLAEIRAAGGKDPLPDPTRIPGPPPGMTALGPPIDPDVPQDWIDPEIDLGQPAPYAQAPPSPLIPKAVPQTPVPAVPNLLVSDRSAAWKGRVVTLSEPEVARISEVVLGALRRELDADLSAVSQKRPRRPRMPAVGLPATPGPDATPVAPRRRGRPRGSVLIG